MQREASLDDQLRNCRAYCARQGWPEPVVYTDAAASGSLLDRPGYRMLLAEVERFDVVLVDDLSRLSRDSIETARTVKRLTFAGVRLVGVSDGVDTARKSHKADVGLRGLMSELYLDDLAEKVHRGLTGRALAGSSAGGLPYGYQVGTRPGERAIDPEQAQVVRRIYREYLDGASPRTIANGLNRDRIPPSRGTTWAMSAIYGDLRRGIGILANPIYVGRQIWNRSHWVKHPETGKRVRQERPESEWIISDCPELAIIDLDTWDAAQARMRQRQYRTTVGKRGGGPGRPPKHLLSGIMRCAECGSPLVVVNQCSYGCATHKDRGAAACPSELRVPRKAAESALLAGIRDQLLTDDAFSAFQREVTAALKQAAPDTDAARRALAKAERERDNIIKAIRAGIITASTKAELERAEADVRNAADDMQALERFQPAQVLPRARETWRRIVADLADYTRDIPAARNALRELLGDRIVMHEKAGEIFAEIAGSSDSLSEISMVAGARSVLYLTAPVRIPVLVKPEREG